MQVYCIVRSLLDNTRLQVHVSVVVVYMLFICFSESIVK